MCFGLGDEQIMLGRASDWDKLAKPIQLESEENTNLWIDSSDFKTTQPEHYSRTSDQWSYKENHYADRFTVIMDARERCCNIRDCGYESVSKECKNFTITTPNPKGRKPKSGRGIKKLTNNQLERNHRLCSLRAKVESPFGERRFWIHASPKIIHNTT